MENTKKLKLPKQVKIAGLTYEIQLKDDIHQKEGLSGDARYTEQVIRIQSRDYHHETVEQTFVHEVVHVLDHIYLNDKLTEDQVDALANGIYAFLKDNNLLK